MPEINIDNEELLYRRVKTDGSLICAITGKQKITSTAFNDVTMKPSVDRSCFRDSPQLTKIDATDGILSLVTEEVRNIDSITRTNVEHNPQVPTVYNVDVLYCPVEAGNPEGLPENLAHSQIESNPIFESQSRFKKLKEALSRLAESRGWYIEPS